MGDLFCPTRRLFARWQNPPNPDVLHVFSPLILCKKQENDCFGLRLYRSSNVLFYTKCVIYTRCVILHSVCNAAGQICRKFTHFPSVKFPGLKTCECKKNDKYQVCLFSNQAAVPCDMRPREGETPFSRRGTQKKRTKTIATCVFLPRKKIRKLVFLQ